MVKQSYFSQAEARRRGQVVWVSRRESSNKRSVIPREQRREAGRWVKWAEVNYGSEKNDVRRIAVNRGKHSTRIAITRFFKL